MKKRTSIVWSIPKKEMIKIVKESDSLAKILKYFGLYNKGGNLQTLKKRLNEEDIDYSHIPLGMNSNKGRKFTSKPIPLEEVMIENSTYNRGSLKKRLLENGMLKNECYICGQEPIHNGKKLVMVLDHINGVSNDHRLENLRLLCPNCNSQTKTFAGRNNKREKKKYFCKNCGKEILSGRKYCKDCFKKLKVKIYKEKIKVKIYKEKIKVKNRPNKNELINFIKNYRMTEIGKKFNISDNAVRKWAKGYNINVKEISPYSQKKRRINPKETKVCPTCDKSFETYYENQKYCSRECSHIASRKTEWPNKKELINLIETTPVKKIGLKFNVIDTTIKRWAKYYEINIREISPFAHKKKSLDKELKYDIII